MLCPDIYLEFWVNQHVEEKWYVDLQPPGMRHSIIMYAEEVSSLEMSIDVWKGKGSMFTGGNGGDASMDAFVRDTEHPSSTTRTTPTVSALTSSSSSPRGPCETDREFWQRRR